MSNLYKTIRISTETHDLLARQGDLKDSFDTVIKKLLQEKEEIKS
jgi:predicted CopG family antitoxin